MNYKFNKTLLNGDIRQRIKLLSEAGQVGLAYLCAKTYGIKEYEEALAEAVPELSEKI